MDDHDARPGLPWFWLIVGLLIAARVVSLAVALNSGQEQVGSILGGDARRFHEIAFAQGTPYADYAVEYPPGALAIIELVDHDDTRTTLVRLGLSQLLLELVAAAALWWGWGRRALLAYLVLGTPFLIYPFPYFRLDMLAVVLATAGMALLRRRHDLSGGALSATAVLAKAWPIVLGGAFVVERRSRAGIAWLVTGAALAAAWVLWAGTSGPIEVFSFRGASGWQVESLPGIVVHLLAPDRAKVESGAWRTGVMPSWSRPALTVLSFGGAVVAWVLADRRRRGGASDVVTFGLAPVVAIASLLVFAPIISPQYMLWLLPWAAVLAAAGDRLMSGLVLGTVVTSTLGMLFILDQVDGSWLGIAPIVARNATLLVLFAVGLAQLAGVLRAPALAAQNPPNTTMARINASAPTRSSVEVSNGTP